MKKATLFLMVSIICLASCKDDAPVPVVNDLKNTTPDSRLTGTWARGGNKYDTYEFASDSNIGKRLVLNGPNGSILISGQFYWRKVPSTIGFEMKKIESSSSSKPEWENFPLEYIDGKSIKVNNEVYSKL